MYNYDNKFFRYEGQWENGHKHGSYLMEHSVSDILAREFCDECVCVHIAMENARSAFAFSFACECVCVCVCNMCICV